MPYQATVDFGPGFDKVDNQINGGFRLRGELGNLGVQLFAVSRHNPDPIFKLVPGGLSLPGSPLNGPLGPSGALLASQPFTRELSGEYGFNSLSDWYGATTLAGLDGLQILNSLRDEWPYLTDLFTVFSAFGLTDAPGDPRVSQRWRKARFSSTCLLLGLVPLSRRPPRPSMPRKISLALVLITYSMPSRIPC